MRSVVIVALTIVVLGCSAGATDDPPVAQTADSNQITGTVLETLDASSYTYVRFETSDGEAWAAVPQTGLEIGSDVVIVNPQPMSNFESKTLGRTFEMVYFGTLEGLGASSPMMTGGANPLESSPGAIGAGGHALESNAGPIELDKAGGPTGRTVAELYAESRDLSGKAVALRGKVVKYSAGIMGRNWIHLQDGTGDVTAGTHDITVTSSDSTAVGEIVLVEGIVTVDKDFGAGYRYAVIVEDAAVR